MTPLDLHWVRAQFALPSDHAFFDNAGGSFTLHRVVARVTRYMLETPIQLGATHALSVRAAERQHEAVAALARMVGVDPGEIVLGPSSSALIDRLARALRPQLRAGDEVIVTEFDHEANISPWLRLQEFGIKVRFWRLDQDSKTARLEDLNKLLGPRTRMVAVAHVSNVLGEIMPVEDIVRMSRDAGAQVLIDGVAYAPHRQLRLKDLGVDYYVMSLYKIFGPHIGLLYGRRERLLDLANINLEPLGRDQVPYKFQPGGVPYELAWGAGGVPEYFDELGRRLAPDAVDPLAAASAAIGAYEGALGARFLGAMTDVPGFHLYGPAEAAPERRVPIFTFRIDGVAPQTIADALDSAHLCARSGHFNAQRLAPALGYTADPGATRVSFAHYNTVEEVDALTAALRQVAQR